MKTINAKWLAFKYKLAKKLNASIESDKEAIKNGAKITFGNYCKIQTIECERKSWSKDAQAIADIYLTGLGYTKQVATYTRIDIDNISKEIDAQVKEAFSTLENSNNKLIAKVASKIKIQ